VSIYTQRCNFIK